MGYKRKETDNMENLLTNGKKKFVKYDEGAALYSMGLNTFQRLAKEAQATVRVGRSVWVNLDLFEKYFQTFAEF